MLVSLVATQNTGSGCRWQICLEAKNKDPTAHSAYHEYVPLLPVTMDPSFQGQREWHIARKFSLTSTASHALVKALLHHYLPYLLGS